MCWFLYDYGGGDMAILFGRYRFYDNSFAAHACYYDLDASRAVVEGQR